MHAIRLASRWTVLAFTCACANDPPPDELPPDSTGRLRVVNAADATLTVLVDDAVIVETLAPDAAWPERHDDRGYGVELAREEHAVEVAVGGATLTLTADLRSSPTTIWVHGSAEGGYAMTRTSPSDVEGWPGDGAVSVVHAAQGLGPIMVTIDDRARVADRVDPGGVATWFSSGDVGVPPWVWLGVGAVGADSAASRYPLVWFDPLASNPRRLDAGLVGNPDDDDMRMWFITDQGPVVEPAMVDVVWHNASPSLTTAAGGAVNVQLVPFCCEGGNPTSLFAEGARAWGAVTRLVLQAADGTVLYDEPLSGTLRHRRTTLVSTDVGGQHVLLKVEDDGAAPSDESSVRIWNLSEVADPVRFLSPGGARMTPPLTTGSVGTHVALPGPGPHDVRVDLGADGGVDQQVGLRDAPLATMEAFLVDIGGAPTLLRTAWDTEGPWLRHGAGVEGDPCDAAPCTDDHVCVHTPLRGERVCAPLVVHPTGCAPGTTWVDLSDGDYFAAVCTPSGYLQASFNMSSTPDEAGAAQLVLGERSWFFEPLLAEWSGRGGQGVRLEATADDLVLWIDVWGTLYEVGTSPFPVMDTTAPSIHGDPTVGARTATLQREGQSCVALEGGVMTLTRAQRWDGTDTPWGEIDGDLEVPGRAMVSRPEPYRPVGTR